MLHPVEFRPKLPDAWEQAVLFLGRADSGGGQCPVWNHAEPQIAKLDDSRGPVVAAALGNEVNLRDFEWRLAPLLGKAKHNNASRAIGPLEHPIGETLPISSAGDFWN